ncbi:MAG: hypothetical protein ACOYCA_04250 [Eggerthellaceae bacterium]
MSKGQHSRSKKKAARGIVSRIVTAVLTILLSRSLRDIFWECGHSPLSQAR